MCPSDLKICEQIDLIGAIGALDAPSSSGRTPSSKGARSRFTSGLGAVRQTIRICGVTEGGLQGRDTAMTIKHKLQNPFALLAQGFVAGALLLWLHAPSARDAPQSPPPVECDATSGTSPACPPH